MLQNNFEIKVLVKGRPITEYFHNGQFFVEGREGSNFEIEFKNLTSDRVETVLSVDGLSVIDGKEAGPESSGYVVEGHSSIRIPGWKLSNEAVASFIFSGKKKSYAAQTTGSARNTGVIGALVFAEKRSQVYRSPQWYGTPYMIHGASYPIVTHTFGFGAATTAAPGSMGSDPMNNAVTPTVGGSMMQMQCSTAHATPLNALRSTNMSAAASEQTEVEQTLGTGFGETTDFATTMTTFTRADLAAMMVVFYDDSRGLRARGIELTRPSRQQFAKANTPQAFPGLQNCVPPKGWKG